MIDLTPLDVRNKRGDFRRIMRGYDPAEVDVFLELAAERLEMVVRENMQLKERVHALDEQVSSQSGREHAVQEALVTAQELRADMRRQAEKEAELVVAEARADARRIAADAESESRRVLGDAERRFMAARQALEELDRRRVRFLKAFRQLLERELDGVELEESRPPLEDRAVELDLRGGAGESAAPERPAEPAPEVPDGIDETPTVRPPLDAAVEDLAAAYEGHDRTDGVEQEAGDRADETTDGDQALSLSFDDDEPATS